MDQVKSALDTVLAFLLQILNVILAAIASVDVWMRGVMTEFGIPQGIQSIIVILAALLLFVLAFKLLSGFLRLLLIVFLILLVVQALGPLGNGPRRVELPTFAT